MTFSFYTFFAFLAEVFYSACPYDFFWPGSVFYSFQTQTWVRGFCGIRLFHSILSWSISLHPSFCAYCNVVTNYWKFRVHFSSGSNVNFLKMCRFRHKNLLKKKHETCRTFFLEMYYSQCCFICISCKKIFWVLRELNLVSEANNTVGLMSVVSIIELVSFLKTFVYRPMYSVVQAFCYFRAFKLSEAWYGACEKCLG